VSSAALLATVSLLFALAASGAEPVVHDPMQPYRAVDGVRGPGAEPLPRFRLTAVLISPTRRVAIVNGKPYTEGAHVNGAQITRIDPQSIELNDGGEELVIHLGRRHAAAPVVEGDSAQ
jgi:hypothetical protein